MNAVILGEFLITSGSITVTDPTYIPSTWCQAILPAENGPWTAEVKEKDGVVNFLEAKNNNFEISNREWKLASEEIGIDSGFVGIYDGDEYKSAWDSFKLTEALKMLHTSCKKIGQFGGSLEKGIICEPGFKDDNFNLYIAVSEEGRVKGIKIKFKY